MGKVLVACEESQAITIELRKRGIEAYSCDLQPCSGGHPEWHIENPIPHKYALELIGKKYDQLIQPYMFGEPESKATCLWIEGLPLHPALRQTCVMGCRSFTI